jgi:hypothetical protein
VPSAASLKTVANTLQVPICSLLDTPAEENPAADKKPKRMGQAK